MKLHFDPNLDFQFQVIETICTLFTSQEFGCTEFTVTRGPRNLRTQFTFAENGLGCRLTLLDEEILHNLKTVRLRSVLPPLPGLRGLHRRAGDRRGLCLPAHDLRTEQALGPHAGRYAPAEIRDIASVFAGVGPLRTSTRVTWWSQ